MAFINHKGQMKITYFEMIFGKGLFQIYALTLNF